MDKIFNIKGVNSSFTRDLGGGTGKDSLHRILNKKGYSKVMKKVFKTADLSKIKKVFKAAGIKDNRFRTSEAIKEKDFLSDLKALQKAGVLKKSIDHATTEFKRMQKDEDRNYVKKEMHAFQNLSKSTKKELLWGKLSEKVQFSAGAAKAAKITKTRDVELGKTKFGIKGWENLEDTDLGKKIRLLRDIKKKTRAMNDEIKKLSMQEGAIRRQAKTNDKLLKKYGLVKIEKDEGKKNSLGKTDNSKTDQKKDEGDNTKTTEKRQVSIASHGSAKNLKESLGDKKIITGSFTKVNQKFSPPKIINESKFSTSTNTVESLNKKNNDQEMKYGFIESTGDINIESNNSKKSINETDHIEKNENKSFDTIENQPNEHDQADDKNQIEIDSIDTAENPANDHDYNTSEDDEEIAV